MYQGWLTFSDSFQIGTEYPGMNGIGAIRCVPNDALAGYLQEQRRDRPGYRKHLAMSGRTSRQSWVRTAEFLARGRGMTTEEFVAAVDANAVRVFGLSV